MPKRRLYHRGYSVKTGYTYSDEALRFIRVVLSSFSVTFQAGVGLTSI